MIKAGDLVRVKDWGKGYTTYSDWFIKNFGNLKPLWLVNYAYNDSTKYDNEKIRTKDPSVYKVLYVKERIALICENCSLGSVRETYLVGVDGLTSYIPPKPMTKEQIEKELGYPIEIVEEEEYEIRFI